jgi:multiple antibiotic resistance protein
LLAFFGIQLSSFELGGDILVALIGLNMLKGESQHNHHHNKADDKENLKSKSSIAIVPLALPKGHP